MAKSAQAFRTIREVADWLDVAAHVLRFWESKFTQIKPVKRAGGRRYYRPMDMELVGGIKVLLHDRGLTIRGVQKLIADDGVDAVRELSPPIDALLNNPNVVQLDPSDAWDMDATTDIPDDLPEDTDDATDGSAPEAEPETQPEAETEPEAEPQPDLVASTEPPLQDPATAETPAADEDIAAIAQMDAAPPTADPMPVRPSPDIAAMPEMPAGPATDHVAQTDPGDTPSLPRAPGLAIDAAQGPLGALAAIAALPAPQRARLAPQIAQLSRLRERMARDHAVA